MGYGFQAEWGMRFQVVVEVEKESGQGGVGGQFRVAGDWDLAVGSVARRGRGLGLGFNHHLVWVVLGVGGGSGGALKCRSADF